MARADSWVQAKMSTCGGSLEYQTGTLQIGFYTVAQGDPM